MSQSVRIYLFSTSYTTEPSLAFGKQVLLSSGLYSGGEKQTVNITNTEINELSQVLLSAMKKIK